MSDIPQILAFLLLLTILFIGDAISTKTKAWVSSVFVCAVLFLIGYWTVFPKDIVSRAGIPPVVAVLLMFLLITNMGTLLSIRELGRQWKTIVIALVGISGIVAFSFTLGVYLFDLNTALVAIPPLVGGIVSALLMSEGALKLGLDQLAVLAVILYVMQGFVGYPLTSIMLKKEGRRVLTKYREGQWVTQEPQQIAINGDNNGTQSAKLFAWLPIQYQSTYFHFFRLSIVAFLAYGASVLLQPIININQFVLCLIFGVIASSIGFLERHPLQKANGFGFAIMGLMLFIFDTLNRATPEMLVQLIYPIVMFITFAVVGMYIFSAIVGMLLGVSKELAFSVSLTALYGFPADYIITYEVINALAKNEKEREVLTRHMLPPMLVGGFVSVTIVSVILAGFFVNMLVA